MKKHKLIIACMIVSAFMLAGCGSKEDTQAIAELQATVDDLQSQVDTYSELQSDLEAANDSIAQLQSQLDTITAEKDAMASKLEALYYIEAMDETMYVISEANIYDGLYDGLLENEATGVLPAEQEIKVTGKSNIIDWYEIDVDGTKKYINGSLLSTTKPQPQQTTSQSSSGNTGNSDNTGTTQQSSGGDSQPSGGGQVPGYSGDVIIEDGGEAPSVEWTPPSDSIKDGGFGGLH